MSSNISATSLWKSLRGSIKQIMTDSESYEPQYSKYCKVMSANKAFHDFQEYAWDGLLTERGDGTPIQTGRLIEGANNRVLMRTFAVQAIVTSDARDDNEQDKVLDIARRIKRAAAITKDIDAAMFLNRFNNASYVFADGVALSSASHTRPDASTFSNTLATPMSPSMAAIQTVRANLLKLEGFDGQRQGYMIEKLICPVDQINAWEVVLGSDKDPTTANNGINNIKKLGIELVPVRQWTGSTTAWGVTTDADGGMVYMERMKDKSNDWVDENTDTLHFGIKYRSGRTSNNARGHYWSES